MSLLETPQPAEPATPTAPAAAAPTTDTTDTTDAPAARDPRRWAILAVLCLSLFAVTCDNTVLNVAIPSLLRDLHLSNAGAQWVVDGYSLVFAGLLLTCGSLSDRYGRRRGLLVGLVLFGVGSALAAASGSGAQLTACRALMGLGGAFLMPGTLSLLVRTFDADERQKAIGIWAGVSGLGVATGPLVGGLLLEHFAWGSVFLVNLPVVVVAIVAVRLLVPESSDPDGSRPDVLGAITSTAGLVSLVWAVISAPERGWTSGRVLGGFAVAALALIAFVVHQHRSRAPMLDLALLRQRRFVAASAAATLLVLGLSGSVFMLSQYLQAVLGNTPLQAGVRTAPVALAIAVGSPLSPLVQRWLGAAGTVFAGMLMAGSGLALIGLLASRQQYWPVALGLVVLGGGMGLAMTPASAALMASMPEERAGTASALNDTMQEVGGSLGVALLGTVLAAGYRSGLDERLGQAPGAQLLATARSSLGSALAAAQSPGVPGDVARLVVVQARAAFATAMSHGLLLGGVFAALGAVVGGLGLRQR